MEQKQAILTIPAEAAYARSVRMLAANFCVIAQANVEEIEDIRMAAEEAFVISCATNPDACEMRCMRAGDTMRFSFTLGCVSCLPDMQERLSLAHAILHAVCDTCDIDKQNHLIVFTKKIGGAYAE